MGLLERARRHSAVIAETALASEHVEQLHGRLIEPLRDVVACDSAAIFAAGDGAVTSWNKEPRYLERFCALKDVYSRELAPMQQAASRDGGVSTDASVFSARERASLKVHREVLEPQRITSMLHIYLPVPPRGTTLICLSRTGRRARAFSTSEVEAARAVVPALILAEALCALRDVAVSPAARPTVGVRLTARERQIVVLVSRGLRNREIAEECGTSVHTVRKQLASVFDKLGVASRTELVARVALELATGSPGRS
jgi:DNA-binding CsgD family transcriptional regulator